jgi:transposase
MVRAIATVQARIEAQLGELAESVTRLDAIPGIGPVAAQMILPRSAPTWAASRLQRI